MGVFPFVVRRILATIPVLLFVTAGTFWLGRYAPGDPITVRTGGKATQETVDRIKHQLNLDQPVYQQYGRYMANLVRGDLGTSLRRPNTKISSIIFPKMWISLQEDTYPFILTFGLGIPLGIYLALRRGHWQDREGSGSCWGQSSDRWFARYAGQYGYWRGDVPQAT